MKIAVVTAALALAVGASTVSAQGADPDKVVGNGGVKVAGWTARLDPSAVAQGRKTTDLSFAPVGGGFHVKSGPAAVYWNAANTKSGNYTVQASFTQVAAAAHPEGYGLIVAGRDLDTPKQSYMYFLVRQDGKFLINHRADDATVHKIVDWTASDAIKPFDAAKSAANVLSVVVGAENLSFRINGTEVKSLPRSVIESGDGHAGSAGVAGIRVNHNLEVHVSDFSVKASK